jgi:hypothetical protein
MEKMNLYRVLLELNFKSGIKHLPRYTQAKTISDAWDNSRKIAGDYNETHRNKCVVYAVKFHESLEAEVS